MQLASLLLLFVRRGSVLGFLHGRGFLFPARSPGCLASRFRGAGLWSRCMIINQSINTREEQEQQQQRMDGAGQPRPATTVQQSMDEVGASVQRALALLHQLHCSVSNFNVSSQLHLLERLNSVQKELMTMHSSAQNCNIPIPIEVVRFIDDGRNPDEFTKDLLNSCVQRNQATKGKVDAFKSLRKNLLEEIEDAFPEETEAYRLIRTQAAAEARRALQATPQLSNGDLKVKSEH